MIYQQVKDYNNVSGTGRKTCPFYDEIDSIIGTRAASRPPTLLESSNDNRRTEEREDEEQDDFSDDDPGVLLLLLKHCLHLHFTIITTASHEPGDTSTYKIWFMKMMVISFV